MQILIALDGLLNIYKRVDALGNLKVEILKKLEKVNSSGLIISSRKQSHKFW